MSGGPVKEPKSPRVKKPLNAFMLFMKEQRPKIAAEFMLTESATINQIVGKRWHSLDKSEQAKYNEMARREHEKHMQLHPGWSVRDNYAKLGRPKKKQEKKKKIIPKKCRAIYGCDNKEQWCKPCRIKKKCIRFIVGADGETIEVPEKDKVEHVEMNSNSNNDKTTNENRTIPSNFDSEENMQQQEEVSIATGLGGKERSTDPINDNDNISSNTQI